MNLLYRWGRISRMMVLGCTRCEKCLNETDKIYVINRFVWCEECFNNIILPQMCMTVKEYFKFVDHKESDDGC